MYLTCFHIVMDFRRCIQLLLLQLKDYLCRNILMLLEYDEKETQGVIFSVFRSTNYTNNSHSLSIVSFLSPYIEMG